MIDSRHAYSLPPDEEVAEVGPIDPQIGILRLDAAGGRTVAVVYNFACHPIQGVPNKGNTADLVGFASQVIEDNSSAGTIALFLQGCGGDINPASYKDVDNPRNAEPLGNMLGLSTLKGLRKIKCGDDGRFQVIRETISLPRADLAEHASIRTAGSRTTAAKLQSLKGTSLSFKDVCSFDRQIQRLGGFSRKLLVPISSRKDDRPRYDLLKMDAENRRKIEEYIENIHVMEQLTRNQTNLALLRKHQADNVAAGKRTIDVEVLGLRIADFVLVTFPGELTVQIGLDIKQASPHLNTFVAGYTNGYIYYSPTAEQLLNVGGAQEDSDCILAPEWQTIFEHTVADLLKKL